MGVSSYSPVAANAIAPSACPFCRDNRVTTTSKAIGDETYWRCQGCGEIWNQSRLHTTGRYW